MHFSIILCHTSMHCWKDSSGMPLSSVVTALLMASTPSKWVPLMIPLSLGKRRKSHGARSCEQGGFSSTVMFFSARNCRMLRALWAGALSWWSSHDLSCHNSRLFSRTDRSKSRRISLQTCWLIVWPCGKNSLWTMPLTSQNVNNMTLTFDFDCLDFFRPRWGRRLPLTALALGFQVELKNSCLITSDDSTKQVWFSLKTLHDVLTHLQAALLLIIIQQPWHHFYADFPHERRCKQKHVKQNSMVAES